MIRETIIITKRDGSKELIYADERAKHKTSPLPPPPVVKPALRDELVDLKAEAGRLGITYGARIGIATLRARIDKARG